MPRALAPGIFSPTRIIEVSLFAVRVRRVPHTRSSYGDPAPSEIVETCTLWPAGLVRRRVAIGGGEAVGELGARADAELAVDAREVGLDGVHGDEQLGRDL